MELALLFSVVPEMLKINRLFTYFPIRINGDQKKG